MSEPFFTMEASVPNLGTNAVASAAQAHAAMRRPAHAGPPEKLDTRFDEMLESALPDRSVPDRSLPERSVPERAARDPSAPPATAPERSEQPDPTAPVGQTAAAVVRSKSEGGGQPKAEPDADATERDAATNSTATEPDVLPTLVVPTVTASAPAAVPVTIALVPETVPPADGSAVSDVLASPRPWPVPGGGEPALTPAQPAQPATPAVPAVPVAAETAPAPEVEAVETVEAVTNAAVPLRTTEQKSAAVAVEPETDDAPAVADKKVATSETPAAKATPTGVPAESDVAASQPAAAQDERPAQSAVRPAHDRPAPETADAARAEPESKPVADKAANPHARHADTGPATTKPAPVPSDAPLGQGPAAGNQSQDMVQPPPLTPASAAVLPGGHAAAAPAANAANAAAAYAPAVAIAGLAVEIVARAREGNNRFEIRLDPPELGRIDVYLQMDRDGNVTSRLYVERSETLDLLRRDAPQLERALNQAGLKTSEQGMEFSLRDQGFGRDASPRPESGPNRLVVADETQPVTTAAPSFYGRRLGLGGGLDIRV